MPSNVTHLSIPKCRIKTYVGERATSEDNSMPVRIARSLLLVSLTHWLAAVASSAGGANDRNSIGESLAYISQCEGLRITLCSTRGVWVDSSFGK